MKRPLVGRVYEFVRAMRFLVLPGHAIVIVLLAGLALAQEEVVAPNENLVVEGIPKIPQSLAESVGRYSEFRAAGFLSWHPLRREMLITTRFSDTPQVHQVKFPGGARTQPRSKTPARSP